MREIQAEGANDLKLETQSSPSKFQLSAFSFQLSAFRRALFLAFVASGFCSLLYQIVWLRLAFASFGVITPVLSTVLSVFMLGLAIGSWLSGKWIGALSAAWNKPAIWFYAFAELLIGIGGILVPWIFALGQKLLLQSGEMNSSRYLILSAVVLCVSILPWCVFMGCTFPFVIAFIRQIDPSNRTGFSFLYLANVIGAMLGAVLTAGVLIELLGLRATLWTAAACNFAIATAAFFLSRASRERRVTWHRSGGGGNGTAQGAADKSAQSTNPAVSSAVGSAKEEALAEAGWASARRLVRRRLSEGGSLGEGGFSVSAFSVSASSFSILSILFLTGFASMAMEVVWTRAFTPVLKTTIYSFAGLLTVYLLATWIGSLLYRSQLARRRAASTATLIGFLAVTVFLPILAEDPRISMPGFLLKMMPFAAQPGSYAPDVFKIFAVLVSIFPFCAGLGYLTPKLIDEYSAGSPSRTGRAYALNVVGCIIGPLFAGYLLLPYLGVAQSLRLLTIPFLLGLIFTLWHRLPSAAVALAKEAADGSEIASTPRPIYTVITTIAVVVLLFVSIRWATSYEDREIYRQGELRRDYTATVLANGEGRGKSLLVNGIAMTGMTPITKIMAHLPLATLERRPESALVICLGMGTTLRSANSWGIDATAVELVPSVRKVYSYFFPDAEEMLKQPNRPTTNEQKDHTSESVKSGLSASGSVARRPNCRVIIDDGRRFLQRTSKKYDLITIDPPPPVEAAGSSLLYSREFYQLLKAHLTDAGIVQVWFPGGEKAIVQAVARSVIDEFPHVQTYHSIAGTGYHFLASMRPHSKPTLQQFHDRLPPKAQADLLEWADNQPLDTYIQSILDKEIPTVEALNPDASISAFPPSPRLRRAGSVSALSSRPSPVITDDRPFNEYFLLRRNRSWLTGRRVGPR